MRKPLISVLSVLLLSACGSSDSASGPKTQPQLNGSLAGTWRAGCEAGGASSNQSDITIATNGTVHSDDRAYGNTDCSGDPIFTSTMDAKYRVLSSTANTQVLEFFDIVMTPQVGTARTTGITVRVTVNSATSASSRIIAGSYIDDTGTPHVLTAEELAGMPELPMTKL